MTEIRPAPGEREDEYLALIREEVWDDRVGWSLGDVVANGRRHFDYEDSALVGFVRRAVAAMVDEGARPRHVELFPSGVSVLLTGDAPIPISSLISPHEDGPVHYGADTPDEIVEGVVATWVAEGMKDLAWGDFRFSMPEAWEA